VEAEAAMSGWAQMDERPRFPSGSLDGSDIPTNPGAYAFYLGGERLYVGKATSLRARLWTNHLRRGASMTNWRSAATSRSISGSRRLPTSRPAGTRPRPTARPA
jgi:hypothetical protein